MSTTLTPQVQAGSFLTLHYRLSGPQGDIINTFDGLPATLTLGSSELSPALEEKLLGLAEGAHQTFEVPAGVAFGQRNPDLIQWISRQWPDLRAALKQGAQQAATLAGRTAQETLQQLLRAGRCGLGDREVRGRPRHNHAAGPSSGTNTISSHNPRRPARGARVNSTSKNDHTSNTSAKAKITKSHAGVIQGPSAIAQRAAADSNPGVEVIFFSIAFFLSAAISGPSSRSQVIVLLKA